MQTPPPLRLDPRRWPRRDHYAWFRRQDFPYMAVTAEVDATALVRDSRAAGVSLFAARLHRLTAAANTVPALRQRIRVEDGEDVVLEYPVVDPGFTVAAEGDLFAYATVPFTDELTAFAAAVAAQSHALRGSSALSPFEDRRDDLLFCSCLPWLRFTAVTHPVPTTSAVDSVPRIAWGRLTEDGGRWLCPVNVQAHHALVDGLHLGRFFAALEAHLQAGLG